MLIAERNLQVKDLLTVALETEMSWLDDAGVDRTDRDLVNLLSFHSVKIGHTDDGRFIVPPAPRIVAGTVGAVEPNWLEPGMSPGTYPILLGNFPLKEMHLRAVRCQGRKTIRVQGSLSHAQQRAGTVTENGI
jgi:hypothetical protein